MFGRYVARQAADRALTAADYDAIGGVVGALRARADAEYEALDDDHRAAMQRLMLRMVSGGAGSLVKRRVSDAELEFADPAERARVHEVLRRLTDARLVVEGTETDGDGYAEPAHDALVRGWGRLIGWIHDVNADAVPLGTRQKLAAAALEWARRRRPRRPARPAVERQRPQRHAGAAGPPAGAVAERPRTGLREPRACAGAATPAGPPSPSPWPSPSSASPA